MAFGLPVATTAWRGLPEILPERWPLVVLPHDIQGLAAGIREATIQEASKPQTEQFRENFIDARFSTILHEQFQ